MGSRCVDDGHVWPGRLIRVVIVTFVPFVILSLKPSLSHELLKLCVAEHGNLLVGEGALDTITVPAESIICDLFGLRTVVEGLLRIHKEGVGFSVVAKV